MGSRTLLRARWLQGRWSVGLSQRRALTLRLVLNYPGHSAKGGGLIQRHFWHWDPHSVRAGSSGLQT